MLVSKVTAAALSTGSNGAKEMPWETALNFHPQQLLSFSNDVWNQKSHQDAFVSHQLVFMAWAEEVEAAQWNQPCLGPASVRWILETQVSAETIRKPVSI